MLWKHCLYTSGKVLYIFKRHFQDILSNLSEFVTSSVEGNAKDKMHFKFQVLLLAEQSTERRSVVCQYSFSFTPAKSHGAQRVKSVGEEWLLTRLHDRDTHTHTRSSSAHVLRACRCTQHPPRPHIPFFSLPLSPRVYRHLSFPCLSRMLV